VVIEIGGYDVLIDDEDYEKINTHSWCIFHSRSERPYVVRYINNSGKQIRIWLHRIIINPPDGKVVDHINNNTLDNRKCNLRICTHKENIRNQKKRKNNASGFKGVYFVEKNKKYRATIRVNGKGIHLGLFGTPEEAHKAYCEASKKYHGEFGRVS